MKDKIDTFISKYENSKISSLCNGLKKDIAAVKNAISSPISSGFVEGNNNKFKSPQTYCIRQERISQSRKKNVS